MGSTDIIQANKWIYARLLTSQIIVDALGVFAQRGGPQIYFNSAIQGNELSIRVTVAPSSAIGQTQLSVTLNVPFARIIPGTYTTNLGNTFTVTSIANLKNSGGILTVSSLQKNIGAGEFVIVPTPQIVFKYLSGKVNRGTGARKIFSKLNYAITARCSGDSLSPIEVVASEIERLFQTSQLESDTVTIGASITQPISYDEILDDGTHVFHFGHQIEMMTYNNITV